MGLNEALDLDRFIKDSIKLALRTLPTIIPAKCEKYSDGLGDFSVILKGVDTLYKNIPVVNMSNLIVEYEVGDFFLLVSSSYNFIDVWEGKATTIEPRKSTGEGDNLLAIPFLRKEGYNGDHKGIAREGDEVEIELAVGDLGMHTIPPAGYVLNIPMIPTTLKGKITTVSGKVKII